MRRMADTTAAAMQLFVNNFWTVHAAHPARDFLRYDFFQTLSIVGGLLLLVNQGPGEWRRARARGAARCKSSSWLTRA
jgi:uncharacterized membrane protein YphA (DoxX/SURF4 family)